MARARAALLVPLALLWGLAMAIALWPSGDPPPPAPPACETSPPTGTVPFGSL